MKKTIIPIIACVAFLTLSCTKTCTCEDKNGKISQLEVNPNEKCSDRSDKGFGTCTNN